MKSQPDNKREALWRRVLSPSERDALRGQTDLELEARLTAALANISDVPPPSNFAARLLAGIEVQERRLERSRGWHWSWRGVWPRLAVVTAVLLFAAVGLQHYQAQTQRIALAKTVAVVADAPPLPNMDALENLDVIQRMSRPARADGALLAALE